MSDAKEGLPPLDALPDEDERISSVRQSEDGRDRGYSTLAALKCATPSKLSNISSHSLDSDGTAEYGETSPAALWGRSSAASFASNGSKNESARRASAVRPSVRNSSAASWEIQRTHTLTSSTV